MNATVITALVRHVLTAVGGGFFASWGISGSAMEAAVGSVATLVGVAWSVYDKKKSN